MTLNSGTIITAPIRPASDTSKYPSAYADEIAGGHHQVPSILSRDNIPAERRRILMLCSVVEDGKTYQLVDGIENSNWQEYIATSKQIITPTFIISSTLSTGVQPLIIKMPKDGIIKSIEAICSNVGSTDCEIAIEKTSEVTLETNSNWNSIFSGTNLKILANAYSNKSAPNYVLTSDIVNQGDVLRLNVIQNGTSIKGLTVQISIEI